MSFVRKLGITVGLILLVMMIQALTVAGQADQSPTGIEDPQKAMEEYMKMMQPSEYHRYLDPLAGDWDMTSTMWWEGPGTDSVISTGTASFEWVLGGRFLLGTFDSEFMGQPYDGMNLLGYDNFRNMYIWSLANSLSTSIEYMKGSIDSGHRQIRFYGEMDEPAIKVTGRMVEYVLTIVDSNNIQLDVIDLHVGEDYKVVEVKYNRSEEE